MDSPMNTTTRELRPAVRFSDLKWLAQSAAHYHHAVHAPRKEPSAAMALGTLVARALFGKGPSGSEEIAVWKGDRRAGKEWEAFKAANSGALIAKQDEMDKAIAIAESIGRTPAAAALLDGAEYEIPLRWRVAGRECATGGIDIVRPDGVVELKTTATSVSPLRFPWFARRMYYHAQLAWYRSGLEAAGRAVGGKHRIIAVETSPPFVCQVFTLTEASLVEGEKLWRGWFETLMTCEEANHWPAYCETELPFDVVEDGTRVVMSDGEMLEVG